MPVQPVDVVVSRALAKRLTELSLDELRAIESHLANAAIDITAEQVSADEH